MIGIDANRPVYFLHGAYRFFCPHERHISRLCRVNVLLLVFDGTLRFVEGGIAYEVKKGQNHIQKAGSSQEGTMESDSPKYCYFHFSGEWLEDDTVIPKTGVFDIQQVQSITRIFDPNQEIIIHGLRSLPAFSR